jgi:hypothetical protein
MLRVGRLPRLCCSTLVSPRHRNCPFEAAINTIQLGRERLRPASTNLCDACSLPTRWLGQRPGHSRRRTTVWLMRSCCACPGACYPRFPSRHCNLQPSTCLEYALPCCKHYEDTMLTTPFLSCRGHHFQYLLCQGCYGKLSVHVKSRVPRLERRAFPAFEGVINNTKISRDSWRAASPGDTSQSPSHPRPLVR